MLRTKDIPSWGGAGAGRPRRRRSLSGSRSGKSGEGLNGGIEGIKPSHDCSG